MTPLIPITDSHLAAALAHPPLILLTTPYEAIAFDGVVEALAHLIYAQPRASLSADVHIHLLDTLEAYAIAHGWRYVAELVNPRWTSRSSAYLRPLVPDLTRVEVRLRTYFATNQRIPYAYEVLHAGLTVAFPAGVREDPEGVISPALWNHLLAPYGFAWNGDPNSLLTPLLPEISASDLDTMEALLNTLPHATYFLNTQHKQAEQGIPILSLADLRDALVTHLGWNPMLRALPPQALLEQTEIRRAVTRCGWSVHPLHAPAYLVTPTPPSEVVALVRLIAFPTDPRPTEIAAGFFPYITKLVTHNESLIYMEMAGTKTALKASRAHLLGTRRHLLLERAILISRDDGIQTVRTPLPSGWEHWALLHRQLSLQSATPDPFYLLDDGTTPIPPLFYTMLAKALPLPLVPAWTAYLWVEGRLAGMIHPIPHTHGIGAWHVTISPTSWQTLLQEGLASGTLAF